MEWKKARHKPEVIEFREAKPIIKKLIRGEWVEGEEVNTLRGTSSFARAGRDYIIKGTHGEVYPIKKEIFKDLYEVLDEEPEDIKLPDGVVKVYVVCKEESYLSCKECPLFKLPLNIIVCGQEYEDILEEVFNDIEREESTDEN